ncbi:MAG: EAL domain-containing protein [Legionella longbeachae]|nr:EAL domain-containing protein [Legionella longbeachae]
MRKISQKLSFFIYQRFKVLWIVLTILLLIIFYNINWHNNIRSSEDETLAIVNKLAFHSDNFINNTLQDVYEIPKYKKEHVTCENDFNPSLYQIIMNQPEISALAIRDRKVEIICSTLPNNQTFFLSNPLNQEFFGPFNSLLFRHPIYVIQKSFGDYQVQVIIISLIFKNILHIPENNRFSITLYDKSINRNIIAMEHTTKHSWIYNKYNEFQSLFIPQKISASAKLNSLDDIYVTVTNDDPNHLNTLWYKQILLFLDIFILSFCLYFLINNEFIKHHSLFGLIRTALKYNQFYPVYQPLFDTNTQTYSGVEVLLRWQGNQDETIMPDFFIEEAEDTGLIVPITLQIVELAFKEAKDILKTKPKFYLSFNICALHFTAPDFFTQFYKLIDHYSISPQQILFEITERDLLDKNNEMYIKRMKELRDAGYSLAIDDYGTGHSSISYLNHFPFNYLKIDKIFIQAIGTNAITETLNDAIITLAKSINLTVIAEGVETEEQVSYLLQNEVHFLQGWYFSKALTIEQLVELLKGEKK